MLFRDIVGQEEIKTRLLKTVRDERISHAQMFAGPTGSGKLALAIAFSQYINCLDKKENDSCGVCSSCIKYNKLIHPDLHFIFPVANTKEIKESSSKDFLPKWREFVTQNHYQTLLEWLEFANLSNKVGLIKVEDCNDIIKIIQTKSYESEYKVMIVWMVEKLFHAAAPKLLKIIEEPPEKTLIILITENIEHVIGTIVSRSQIIKIPKIKDDDIINSLTKNHGIYGEEAEYIVKFSKGNYNEVIKIINNNEEDNEFHSFFRSWMQECYKNNISKIGEIIEEISKIGREKQKKIINYSIERLRECVLYNYNIINNKVQKKEKLKFINDFSVYLRNCNFIEILNEFDKSIYYIERNANPKLVFMNLSIVMIKVLRKI